MILEKKETTATEASLHGQGGSGACVEAGPGGWRRRPGARRGRGRPVGGRTKDGHQFRAGEPLGPR